MQRDEEGGEPFKAGWGGKGLASEKETPFPTYDKKGRSERETAAMSPYRVRRVAERQRQKKKGCPLLRGGGGGREEERPGNHHGDYWEKKSLLWRAAAVREKGMIFPRLQKKERKGAEGGRGEQRSYSLRTGKIKKEAR